MSIADVLKKIDSGDLLATEINDYIYLHFDAPEETLRAIRTRLDPPRRVASRRFGKGEVIQYTEIFGIDCVLVDFDGLYKVIVDDERYLDEEDSFT